MCGGRPGHTDDAVTLKHEYIPVASSSSSASASAAAAAAAARKSARLRTAHTDDQIPAGIETLSGALFQSAF